MLVVFGVTAILPVAAVRHVPLFGLSVLVIVGEHLDDGWHRILSPGQDRGTAVQGNWLRVPLLMALLASSCALAGGLAREFRLHTG
jgi:hypothetical protein